MSKIFDVIIIGSGPAGCHAALPLLAAGKTVAMIDGGIERNPRNFTSVANEQKAPTFEEFRRTAKNQDTFFLGQDFSVIFEHPADHAAQMVSGRFSHVVAYTTELLPIQSRNTTILQSLACGGLSEVWGGACDFFDADELTAVGLPVREITKEYQEVVDLIGVSGPNGSGYRLQPPPHIDAHGRQLLADARKHPSTEFEIHQSFLALLTQPIGRRKACAYKNMEYWLNVGRSIYRAKDTVEELKKNAHFSYFPGYVVTSCVESDQLTHVFSRSLSAGRQKKFSARALILAAGSVNTSRILLHSLKLYDVPVPFLTKKHTVVPCIHLPLLGQVDEGPKHSLCQAVLMNTQKFDHCAASYAQLYSYSSLLLSSLLSYSPLPIAESLRFFALLAPSLVLADIRFPTTRTEGNVLQLHMRDEGKEVLKIEHQESAAEKQNSERELKRNLHQLRTLHILPLKTVTDYTTAHYAGGVPTQKRKSNLSLSCDTHCKVRGTKNIYVADAASWNILPAKPPTLTIMANARRVGKYVGSKV